MPSFGESEITRSSWTLGAKCSLIWRWTIVLIMACDGITRRATTSLVTDMDEVRQGCQRLMLSVKLPQSTLKSVSPKEGMTQKERIEQALQVLPASVQIASHDHVDAHRYAALPSLWRVAEPSERKVLARLLIECIVVDGHSVTHIGLTPLGRTLCTGSMDTCRRVRH